MSERKLGKIQSISIGYGGYQEAQFGVSITLGSDIDSWGVGDFKGGWSTDIKITSSTQWTEEDRLKIFADTMVWLNNLMKKAKVKNLTSLKGKPVWVIFNNNALKEWDILKEVV